MGGRGRTPRQRGHAEGLPLWLRRHRRPVPAGRGRRGCERDGPHQGLRAAHLRRHPPQPPCRPRCARRRRAGCAPTRPRGRLTRRRLVLSWGVRRVGPTSRPQARRDDAHHSRLPRGKRRPDSTRDPVTNTKRIRYCIETGRHNNWMTY
ncbi:hypothetical protein PLANTIT3_50007 [Plantibacter sp. T3]|nr:hypothetical protein PLANTIT3_50007 [Plantibacter sp. T3]